MKSAAMRLICRILIVSMAMLPFQIAQAGMIGTDQIASISSAQSDRAAVLSLISRSEVSSQLQALGISPGTARDRVEAMTDQEVRSLAGQLDSLPAGAKSNGWVWAVVIIVGLVIYFNWK